MLLTFLVDTFFQVKAGAIKNMLAFKKVIALKKGTNKIEKKSKKLLNR